MPVHLGPDLAARRLIVGELRQVWSWAMQEGASNGNQPAPIVHNGVLYVNNAGMVLQALDAKTGELIWENHYGSNPAAPVQWTCAELRPARQRLGSG